LANELYIQFTPQNYIIQMLPTLFLNHFYLILGPADYQAVRDCRFLWDEFALGEERTTLANNGDTWTGTYFYGENTYFEFLDAGALRFAGAAGPGALANGVGLALGTETQGCTAALLGHLRAQGRDLPSGLRTRHYQGTDLPWFYCSPMQIFRPGQALSTWLMEYHPDFLAHWRPELGPGAGGIARSAILAKYRQALGHASGQARLLQEVAYLRLRLDPLSAEAALAQLTDFGGTITHLPGAMRWQAQDFWLEIILEGGPPLGWLEVGFSLREAQPNGQEWQIGPSSLRVGPGPVARWTFGGQ
jgi:Family of unknown function (DUF5829)